MYTGSYADRRKTPSESGPQHIDVVHVRRTHDRPGARSKGQASHTQLSPGGGIHVIVDMNELRGGHGSRKCGCRQIVKLAKPDPINCHMRRIA